jgi:hypothetical protein
MNGFEYIFFDHYIFFEHTFFFQNKKLGTGVAPWSSGAVYMAA